MKTTEHTVDALIKQYNGKKKPDPISKSIALLDKRVTLAENAIQSDAFKEAVSLVHFTNIELIATQKAMRDNGYVLKSELSEYIDRSDFETFLWCMATAAATALGVLLAVWNG